MGMRRKTIKAILSKKFNEFTASIEGENLRNMVKENSIITGGAIASMLLGEEVNDFDIYFKNSETAFAVARYYIDRFQNDKFKTRIGELEDIGGGIRIPIKYDNFVPDPMEEDVEKAARTAESAGAAGSTEKKDYRPVFISPNCISLSNKVQLIVRFYGSPAEIHENYDFIHCTNYWDGDLVLRPDAMEALLARELVYFGSKYPVCSLMRVRKFVQRGWKINAGQLVKMAWQIYELNLCDPSVLEDQLVGVDTAYFQQLIFLLKEKNVKEVEGAFLFQLIDEVF